MCDAQEDIVADPSDIHTRHDASGNGPAGFPWIEIPQELGSDATRCQPPEPDIRIVTRAGY